MDWMLYNSSNTILLQIAATMKLKLEDIVKEKLIERGFTEKTLLNNRGLIGATIEETVLRIVTNITK